MNENAHQGVMFTSAVTDHEMFNSWLEAGFTRDEALQLLLNGKANSFNLFLHELHCPHSLGETGE